MNTFAGKSQAERLHDIETAELERRLYAVYYKNPHTSPTDPKPYLFDRATPNPADAEHQANALRTWYETPAFVRIVDKDSPFIQNATPTEEERLIAGDLTKREQYGRAVEKAQSAIMHLADLRLDLFAHRGPDADLDALERIETRLERLWTEHEAVRKHEEGTNE